MCWMPMRRFCSARRRQRRAISHRPHPGRAEQTGAEAIHPGYGFLSENVEFARECARRGIVFIGPRVEQIEAFALKHTARRIAERCGVPLLPGTGHVERRGGSAYARPSSWVIR